MKIKLTTNEIQDCLNIEKLELPKYAGLFLNFANRYSQGTRPRVVGQLSELIKEVEGKTLSEWEEWYMKEKPDAMKMATEKILGMLNNFKSSLEKIDKTVVEQWVRDLVIVKTFVGMRFQEAILMKGAEIKGSGYSLSSPEEESQGIDGYIGDIAVSIKPHTYKTMEPLSEGIGAKIIYYEKIDGGIEVDYSEIM
jgi:hypothetical protein